MNAPTISSNQFDIISTVRSDEILLTSQTNITVNRGFQTSNIVNSPLQFYMLGYHIDRMLASAKAFGWDASRLEEPQALDRLVTTLYDHIESNYGNRHYP